jgi:signal peptidase I
VADWNDVPTGSMKPTILIGDRIFVNKLAYDLKVPFTTWRLVEWGAPARGDIVTLYSPDGGTRLVKRVIGLPGDRLEMRGKRLLINGEPVGYEPAPEHAFDEGVDSAYGPMLLANERLPGTDGAGAAMTHPVMVTRHRQATDDFPEIEIPDGMYFVMGDNRDLSRDSRAFGLAPRDQIIGRATRVVLSFDHDRYYLPRIWRFFHALR